MICYVKCLKERLLHFIIVGSAGVFAKVYMIFIILALPLVTPVQKIIEKLLILWLANSRNVDKLQLDTGIKRFINQQKLKKLYSSTIIKRRHLNFIFWNIAIFSLVQSVTASNTDKPYSSYEDVFDGLLNTLFPISFVILFKSSREPESVRNTLLPLLDDALYNVITWLIPLIISLYYDNLLVIEIYAILNMCLHIACATITISQRKKVNSIYNEKIFQCITTLLVCNQVIVTPTFWIVYIKNNCVLELRSITFLASYCILLLSLFIYLLLCFFLRLILEDARSSKVHEDKAIKYLFTYGALSWFYVPNILQTLWIILNWPVNFYFVKTCIFILLVSLTRNVSYFVDEVPDGFIATSTTSTQWILRKLLSRVKEIKKNNEREVEEGSQGNV